MGIKKTGCRGLIYASFPFHLQEMAKPPGKRRQRILSCPGGEKERYIAAFGSTTPVKNAIIDDADTFSQEMLLKTV